MNKSFYIQSRLNKFTTHSHYLALESRLVFDGAVVATAVDVQNTASDQSGNISTAVLPDAPPAVDFSLEKTPQIIDFLSGTDNAINQPVFFVAENSPVPLDLTSVTGINPEQSTHIIVVDSRAENAAFLSANPPANTQVFVLDTARDGFQQITDQLQGRQEVTQLDIIPWTQNGQQWLGSKPLTATLESSVNNNLMRWNDGLANDARLVFHGQNDMGTAWLNYVSALTGTQTSWLPATDFSQNDTRLSANGSSMPTSIYFIDSAVQNSADIVSGIDANAEIVYLDATKDGLSQIADYLAGRTNIDSIQIISHGGQAALQLGNEILTNDNLSSHAEQLARIGHALTAGGDILLYGCDLAQSTAGSKFIDSFSYLTQADVAASTDLTGTASKGGNWVLEYTAGTIEASILASSHYQDILALPTFNVAGGALLFTAPSLRNGTGLNAGSIILFDNVITIGPQSIDAVVTIVDIASGASVIALDSLPPGLGPNAINGNWFEFITQTNTPNAAVTIKFEFIKNGTYNNPVTGSEDVLLQNLIVNSYDIDNTQFQDFSGFSSYSLAVPVPTNPPIPDLSVATNNGFTRFADTTGQPNDGINNLPGGLPADVIIFNQARVTATYNEINTFQIKVGATNATEAFFYLDFGQTYDPISPSNTFNVPTAVNDVKTGTRTGTTSDPVTVDVTSNDSDLDKNSNPASVLDPATVKIVGATEPDGSKRVPGQGTWSVVLDTATGKNVIIFTPLASFTANPTPISYTVKDTGGLESNPATVTINYPPIATNDTGTGITGSPITVKVINNDVNTGVPLNPASVQIVGAANPGDPLVVPGQGIWSVNTTTGEIIFTPDSNFKGNPTPISYTVKDTGGLVSNPALVTVNYPPIAIPDTATGVVGNPVTIDVINNDVKTGDPLNPASVQIVGTTNPGDPLVVPGQGTWSVNTTTGQITFTPIAGFVGSPDVISYTVKDTIGLVSLPTTVTVIMNPLPLANPDTNTASVGGSPVTGDLITNDQPGAIPTFVTSASQGATPIIIGSPFTTAAGAILILNADGSYSYTPPGNVTLGGLTERFNYTITDSNGNTSSSILTIVVAPITSGSLIQLSNPSLSFSDDRSIFFAAKPFEAVVAEVSHWSLYIPTPDNLISLTGSLRNQVVLELERFSFDIPAWAFRHTNPNEQLILEATRPDGSALPEWLKFNPKLLQFSGIPPKGAHNEVVMVTATDSYGNQVHAVFTVHVNKERARPDHKYLTVDPKLMGITNKVPEKLHKEKSNSSQGKSGLSEQMHALGKSGKLQESRALLDRLNN